MHGDSPVSWLMFFTLVAGVFVIAGAFISFLRHRSHREIAANALGPEGADTPRAAAAGAGVEMGMLFIAALGVMGLLAAGYHSKPKIETAQAPTPVGVTTTGQASTPPATTKPPATTTGMTQQPGTPDQPKNYQPANPGPDPRAATTSSDTGSGPASGSTGRPVNK